MSFNFKLTDTRVVLLLSILALTAFTINFRQDLMTTYIGMVVFSLAIYSTSIGKKYNVNQIKGNSFKSWGAATIAMLLFIGVSLIAATALQSVTEPNISLGSVVAKAGFLSSGLREESIQILQATLSETQITTILNNLGTVAVFVGLIPIIETIFAIAALLFLAKLFKLEISNLRNPRNHLLFGVIGAGMMYLHIAAKGVTNNLALLLTFLFFTATCYMVALQKEQESVIQFHILNNGLAIFRTLRWI